jgi:hypothetical protein
VPAARDVTTVAAWRVGVPQDLTRRHLVLLPWASGLAAAGNSLAAAPVVSLPAPAALAESLASALRERQPLVVMASLHGCPFCAQVRDHHLGPLRASGQAVVQLDMQDARPVRDFAGVATTHGKLLRDWGVSVAPTVLFFGRDGREVAQRLAGASIPDFYGAYLDERLAQARAAIG